jgi:hypothetical protein
VKAQVHTYETVAKDISLELFPDNAIYQLRNGRMTTAGELGSDGGVMNIKGTKYSFTLPQGFYILGHACIVDTAYLMTTDDLTEEGGTGYVYKLKVSPKTLEVDLQLIYSNEDLKFSIYRTIQAHGIRENSNIERLYFSDHHSETRGMNVLSISPDSSIEFTQLHPDASFKAPIVDTIIEGGELRRGIYEYAFFLTTYDGKTSLLSENSVQVSLIGSGFVNARDYNESEIVEDDNASPEFGSTLSSNKSVKVTLDVSEYPEGLYVSASLVAIYSGGDIGGIDPEPEVSIVDTVDITDGTASFIHSGTESEVILSYTDYLDNRYAFFTNKTFASKDNILFVGNTKTATSIVDYDASVKRYNSSSETYEDIYKNPYNDESGTYFNSQQENDIEDWKNQHQYKYQDPSINPGQNYLGGTGENIDYKFILHKLEGISKDRTFSNAVTVNETLSFEQDYPSRYTDDFNSPYLRFLRGFKRGEIYRFAISFTSTKGNKAFAKYIGDIKMPELSEKAGYITIPGTNVDYFPIALTPQGGDPQLIGETSLLFPSSIISDNEITSIFQLTITEATTGSNQTLILSMSWGPDSFIGMDEDFAQSLFGQAFGSMPTSPTYYVYINGVETLIAEAASPTQGGGLYYDPFQNTYSQTIVLNIYDNVSLEVGDVLEIKIQVNTSQFISNALYITSGSSLNILQSGITAPAFYSLGVEFNVKNIPEGYDSYQICMVPREDRFKTRLTQGYGTKCYRPLQNFTDDVMDFLAPVGNPITINTHFDNGTNQYGQNKDSRRGIIPLHTPEVSYNFLSMTKFGNSYLKPIGAYSNPKVYTGTSDGWFTTSLDDLITRDRGSSGGTVENQIRAKFFSTKPFSAYEYHKAKHFEKIKDSARRGPDGSQFTFGNNQIRNYLWNFDQTDASQTNGAAPGLDINYVSKSGSKQFVELANTNTYTLFGGPGVFGPSDDSSINPSRDLFVFDYIRLLPEHYGGNDQDSVSKNIFKPITRPIFQTGPAKVFGGDIFISFYDSLYGMWDLNAGAGFTGNKRGYYINMVVPVESTMNLDVAHGKTLSHNAMNTIGDADTTWGVQETGNSTFIPYYDYDNAYSIFSLSRPVFTQPLRFQAEDNAPTRIYISDTKIYGEQEDSWSKFRISSFKDLDPSYGSLTSLKALRDNVLFIQEEGMGALSINPRAIVTTSDSIATELGTSEGIQRYDYISTESGSKHQLSIVTSENSLSYYDVVNNRWMMFTSGKEGGLVSLGEAKGFQSLFLNLFEDNTNFQNYDRPYVEGGVVGYYDTTHREFYLTFHGLLCPELIYPEIPQDLVNTNFYVTPGGNLYQAAGDFNVVFSQAKFSTSTVLQLYQSMLISDVELQRGNSITLTWSEKKQSFNDTYDHRPFLYFGDNKNTFSSSPLSTDRCFIHNHGRYGEFYDVTYPFEISLIVNGKDDKPMNKILAYTEYNAIAKKGMSILQDKTFDTMRVHNDYQDSGVLDLDALPDNSEHERRFRKWRFNMPLDEVSKDYIRGPWSVLTLTCDNLENYTLALQTLINYYTNNEY